LLLRGAADFNRKESPRRCLLNDSPVWFANRVLRKNGEKLSLPNLVSAIPGKVINKLKFGNFSSSKCNFSSATMRNTLEVGNLRPISFETTFIEPSCALRIGENFIHNQLLITSPFRIFFLNFFFNSLLNVTGIER
jgi:hypothetical protein